MKNFIVESFKAAFMGVYIALALLASMLWAAVVVCIVALPFALVILAITWAINCILIAN